MSSPTRSHTSSRHPLVPPSLAFRREREQSWRELEALVLKAESGSLRALGHRELARLPILYRSTLASLAVARNLCLNRNLLEYLETLCARAYACMSAPPTPLLAVVADFFARRFPRTVRRYALHVALSALVLLLGAATGFIMTAHEPELFYTFVDPAYASGRDPGATTEELRQVLYHDGGGDPDQLSAFASMLLSNNARIGMMCFALGFAFGIPVVYLLFSNGLIIGAFAALYESRGLGWDFFGWILPHGVPEIFAIILCGAGGLAIAQALIAPGRTPRLDALRRTGRDGGTIVLGAVFLFIVAALIEGFFRQLVGDITLRYTMVVFGAMTLATWLSLAGRSSSEAPT